MMRAYKIIRAHPYFYLIIAELATITRRMLFDILSQVQLGQIRAERKIIHILNAVADGVFQTGL